MKNLILTCCLLINFTMLAQQSGIIKYTEVEKLDIQTESSGDSEIDLSKFLPDNFTYNKVLTFNNTISTYETNQDEEDENDLEMESEDGTFKIEVYSDDNEDILYLNHNEKVIIDKKKFMGKLFKVVGEFPSYKWKVIGDKIKYLGYECLNASTINEDGKTIIAWFAPQVPAPIGPRSYGGLPGAILMLATEDKSTEIKATSIEFYDTIEINVPKKGKEVSQEEFKAIVDEKNKEMKESLKGEGMMIQIRG